MHFRRWNKTRATKKKNKQTKGRRYRRRSMGFIANWNFGCVLFSLPSLDSSHAWTPLRPRDETVSHHRRRPHHHHRRRRSRLHFLRHRRHFIHSRSTLSLDVNRCRRRRRRRFFAADRHRDDAARKPYRFLQLDFFFPYSHLHPLLIIDYKTMWGRLPELVANDSVSRYTYEMDCRNVSIHFTQLAASRPIHKRLNTFSRVPWWHLSKLYQENPVPLVTGEQWKCLQCLQFTALSWVMN